MPKRGTTKQVNGKLVEQLIDASPWGPRAVAAKAKVGIQTVYQMKRGERVEADLIAKVAATLGVPTWKLIEGAEDPAALQPAEPAESSTKTELVRQADAMGINLMLNVPVGQDDPSGQLSLFAKFMAEALEEYTNYIRDAGEIPEIPMFADYMRSHRRNKTSVSDEQIEEWRQIRIYFIISFDNALQRNVYFYAAVGSRLHEQMLQSLNQGDIPDFAVIVAQGFDEPSQKVKDAMKSLFGFDHDELQAKARRERGE